jgi:hypothetical protein
MTENTHPQSKEELMQDIEREWNLLLGVIARLSPEQMTAPDPGGWSPKDNLAHLSAWMNFMRRADLGNEAPHSAMGIEEQKFKELDEDGINAVIFERNRNRSTEDVVNEIKKTYNETIQTLNRMSYADLMKPLKPDDPLKRPILGWVTGNTSEHFAEHRSYIERAFNRKKP